MGDRSRDVTEPRDTEDLLEETERLLSEGGSGADRGRDERSTERSGSVAPGTDPATGGRTADDARLDATENPTDETTGDSSRLPGLPSVPAVGDYFSPKAFLTLVLVTAAGLFAGATVLPFGGRIAGLFVAAFAVGLFASRRRYLEVTAAGTTVGGVSALLGNAVLAAAGSFGSVVAVGVVAGLVATLVGYYFGRDLRDGLSREVP